MCPTCDLSFPSAEPETPKEKEKPAAVKKGTAAVILHISLLCTSVNLMMHLIILVSYILPENK